MTDLRRHLVRNSRSPAILWFMQKYGFPSAEGGIATLAERLAKLYGEQAPPFDLAPIANELGVLEVSSAPIGEDALLIPTDNGFRIRIGSQLPRLRQRFALAHELGHTLFFNRDVGRPHRPYSRSGTDRAEERLCDVFAAAILVPERSLRQLFASARDASLPTLLRMAKRFDVSVRCLAIRIADLRLWDAAVVAWAPDFTETVSVPDIGAMPKLRVNWEATPRGSFVPLQDSAKPQSVCYLCYHTGLPADSDETMSLGSIRGVHHISCMRTSSASTQDSHGVLSLIRLAISPRSG